MDFQIHQLSPANLASIFNAAFMDAEVPENSDFCAVKGDDLHILIWPREEDNLLRFTNFTRVPDDLKTEDLPAFFAATNQYLSYAKVFPYKPEDNSDGRDIIFEYDYPILKDQGISSKALVQIARTFEKSVLSSVNVYFQLFAPSAR